MIKYVVESPYPDGKPLYVTSDFNWTSIINEAKMFNNLEEANSFIGEFLSPSLKLLAIPYELELSEIIEDSLKLL